MRSLRTAFRAARVPASSAPISRLYPTTSAARIAVRRRSMAKLKEGTARDLAYRLGRLGRDNLSLPDQMMRSCDARQSYHDLQFGESPNWCTRVACAPLTTR